LVTEQEARDMKTAITGFEDRDELAAQTQFNADLATAERWFNTLNIDIQGATTRTEALSNFNQIESLNQSETDRFRLMVLGKKLREANEKYKQVKRVNP